MNFTKDIKFFVRDETWTARVIAPLSSVGTIDIFEAVIDIYDASDDWMERLENTEEIDLIMAEVFIEDYTRASSRLSMIYIDPDELNKAKHDLERKQVEATYKYSPFNPDGSRKE